MRTPSEDVPIDERRKRLERRAEVIRSRLLRTVDALDARRHQVVTISRQAKAMAKPAALSLLGVVALVGGTVVVVGLALRARRRRSISDRVSHRVSSALQRLAARQPSLFRRTFDGAVFSLVTFAARELAKRTAKNLVDGRLPDGRLAVGDALTKRRRRRVPRSASTGGAA